MAYDSTEQEQVEALKRFWAENGKALIGGTLIGLALFFSYQFWSSNQKAEAEAASMEYMGMMDKLSANKLEEAADFGSRIIGSYADTAYAPLSALAMARIKLEQGDSVTARAHLNWAIEHSDMKEIQNIARIRLAAVLLSDGLTEQALASLNKVKDESFSSLKNETLGDIYAQMNNHDKAQQAYKDALATMEQEAGQRANFLQMKLDDVAGL